MDGKQYVVLIGAPKCGTTSLAAWLGELPDAALARYKETMFFTDYGSRDWTGPGAKFIEYAISDEAAFEDQFAHAPGARLRIEATTDNLSHPGALERIQEFAARDDVRSVKLVAVLRDPVKRIVSEYEHTLRMGWQTGSLLASLEAEEARIRDGWQPLFHHVKRSRYAAQLARFRAAFGDDLLILDYHSLSDPETLPRLAAFVGRDGDGQPEALERRNARAVYANPEAEQVLRNKSALTLARAMVPKKLRPALRGLLRGKPQDRYRPDAAETKFILDALGEDIDACFADPEIPTGHWTCRASAAA